MTDAAVEAELIRLRVYALAFARSIMSRYRSAHDPEDIVQSAYLRVWIRRAVVEDVQTYLLKSIHNAAVSSLRRRRCTGGYEPTSDGLQAARVPQRMQEQLDASIAANQMLARLELPAQRRAMDAWLAGGAPPDMNNNTYKVRVHRAMNVMRQMAATV